MLLNYGVGQDSWASLGLQGDPTNPSKRKSVLNIHWKDWWWSWNSNTLHLMQSADSLEKTLVLGKIEGRRRRGRQRMRWLDGITMRWTQVWVSSGSWWCTGKPGMLQSLGSQKVGHDWVTELYWTDRTLISHFQQLIDHPDRKSTRKHWSWAIL